MTHITYHADVVGSLLRPAYLLDAREKYDKGELTAAEFKAIEDRAVDETIAAQEGAGLPVVTDGEVRRLSFMESFMEGVDGVVRVSLDSPDTPKSTFHTDDSSMEVGFYAVVNDRLSHRRFVSVEEFVYARSVARRPIKVTLPSPMLCYLMWSPKITGEVYSDPFELFAAAGDLIRREVVELARLGATYIQIDAPEIAHMCDPTIRDDWDRLGIDHRRVLTDGIDLLNGMVAGVSGPQFGIHLCRGNAWSAWIAQGGYSSIAKDVFPRITNFSTVMLEYDDERSGDFAPLADLPDDKTAVLGLVTTKKGTLESSEELIGRIKDASKFHPEDQLGLSTQCGFASDAIGNSITRLEQDAKLRLISRVADEVWG